MTVGALYQIKNLNSNAANNFLDFDPQISFFKVVFRKHTRFAMENIEMTDLSRKTLDYDNNVIIKCDIPRNADLLNNLYFTFELPAIYSGKYTSTGTAYEYNYEFNWIKNIGTNIFNYVSLKISNQEVDKIYSDYFTIWKELMLDIDQKNQYDKNIGSIPELYDPKNAPGMNGSYPNITSSSTPSVQSGRWDNNKTQVIEFSSVTDHTIPSIPFTKIKVPLIFWFCNNSGLALPLIALQYSKISLEFEMKPFKDLYTIIDPKYSTTSFKKRIKPQDENHHQISNFTSNYSYNINPKIEGEYIFLDEDERRRFALNDHEYLMTQSRLTEKDGVQITGTTEETMAKLVPAFNPVSFITWIIKRDDMKSVNDWNNYSNWLYEDVPPYSNEYNFKDGKYNMVSTTNMFYDPDISAHRDYYTLDYFKKNIMKSAKIEFDGNLRIDKDADYYSKQQIYQHFKTNPKDGIYVYSFSINPKEYQPSGSCNFSNINIPRIYFKRDTISSNFTYYNHRAFIFIVSYNILAISNGMGFLKFTN